MSFNQWLDRMETTVLQLAASVLGLFVGTFLFSRVGSWIGAIVTALKTPRDEKASARQPAIGTVALVAVLNSGPWLLAGVLYWAYYVLSESHAPAWDWFFGAVAAAVPVWLTVSIYLYRRGKRIQAERMKEENAV